MVPAFACWVIKENSYYSLLLYTLDTFSEIEKSSNSLLRKLKFIGENCLQVVNVFVSF